MDWNLKIPSWDITEFDQQTIQNIDAASGSNSFTGEGTFSVDLKLGQVIDSGNEFGEKDNLKVSKMELSPSGSSKRARAINSGVNTTMCLVDGCNANLSNCREYHRRHKVCELHSKTPQVTINGRNQRFCQQCSRFHSLEEFDEGKRSCRKRLDGHNRRRRKYQPEPLSPGGSFFSTTQGTRLLSFSSPQTYPAAAVSNPIWSGIVNADEDGKFYNQHSISHLHGKRNPYPETSPSRHTEVNQHFSFLHSTGLQLISQTSREASSDCALSLLSSSPTQTREPKFGLSHVTASSSISNAHALNLNPNVNHNRLEPIDPVVVPHAGNDDDDGFHYQKMLQHIGPRDRETPQTLPFYWE